MAAVSKLPANWLKDLPPEAVAYLQKIETQANAAPDLSDVDVPADADTTATVTTRTFNDSLNSVPGVDPGTDPATLGNGGGTTVGDSFKKIANEFNTVHTNCGNLLDAIETLSDRLNAALAVIEELRAAVADE